MVEIQNLRELYLYSPESVDNQDESDQSLEILKMRESVQRSIQCKDLFGNYAYLFSQLTAAPRTDSLRMPRFALWTFRISLQNVIFWL